MPQITVPAVKIEQDGKDLFLTRFTVADISIPGFYRVEELVVGEKGEEDEGYQRALDERRAKKMADYIREVEKETFIPTSLFLATAKELEYNTAAGEITFDVSGDKSQPLFYMVDGQHRAAGLRKAAERLDLNWLRDFPVPAVVATGLTSTEQMVQFLIVNTTQKKVGDGIAQQILAQFKREEGVAQMPNLPKIISEKMGGVNKALDLVKYLNSCPDSPWHEKIEMANQPKAGTTAKQPTFVKSLNEFVLKRGHPLALEPDGMKRNKMLQNYWLAVAGQFTPPGEEGADIPLFRTSGMDIFHMASMDVFEHLARNGQSFTEENFRACFQSARKFINDDEFANMYEPEFWKRGGLVKGFNKGANRKYAKALSDAVKDIRRDAAAD